MAGKIYLPGVILTIWQFSVTTASKTCTYHTYNYGHSRVVTYSCQDWEYCCSGVCCDYPVLIHRLWYFWVGILAVAFFILFASVTWYKKRYYGRILRVHPAGIGPGAVQMHTVTTQQVITTPPYPGPYIAVPPGPPPPYSALPVQPLDKQPPPAGPMQPGYLPNTPIHPCHGHADTDSNHLF